MNVLIIGCGWLGFPLAKHLLASDHKVLGTTTRNEKIESLHQSGIVPFLFRGEEDLDFVAKLNDVIDLTIITVPPSSSLQYPDLIGAIAKKLPKKSAIIFTSSIGVYPSNNLKTDESSECISDHPVFLAEEQLRTIASDRLVILRLGGLFGAQRHPVKFLAGRNGLTRARSGVNLVHLNDVIQAIETLILTETKKGLYNLVYPDHPAKEDYYKKLAKQMNLEEPNYSEDDTLEKIVSGDQIVDELGFKYSHDLWTKF